ncbi:sensor histidine kinase [Streptomyces sp. NPDC096310]|uniref:sensor histidine kinase n=1 Tax=Streptomyces sp. NPDC096310 TaxID=3366082 RepID=UPI0037F80BA6
MNAHAPLTADPPKTTPSSPLPVQRALSVALYAVLTAVWLGDVVSTGGLRTPERDWLLPLVSGPVAAVFLHLPYRWLSLERRAWIAACGSTVLTGVMELRSLESGGNWGVLESVCLLILLARTCRRAGRPYVAVALGIAVLLGPVRLHNAGVLAGSFSLTFAIGAAVAFGCYLRVQDGYQARAMDSVRQAERMELARDLHDFVAHHVTGIVVQANAGLAIRATAPEHLDPILESIQKSGMETLDSMRRLVRVLREVEGTPRRPGELFTELAGMVSGFCGGEDGADGADATLSVAAAARSARLAPEVELSVHRVVQESLTNAQRHAPGALVAVRVDTEGGRLRVEIDNTPPAAPPAASPVGGRGGFGMVGLRERVAAVEGLLEAGRTPDGGWRVVGVFPVLDTAGSAA